ncbi:hypothetical protein COBT_002033 [Conglomerata obtusa]
MFTNTFEIKLEIEELNKIKNKENVILISNHIGAIDFMAINEISKRKGMLKHAKYMIKESIKYVPILGYIQFLGFVMLKRNYEKDVSEIKTWLNYFKNNNVPVWFVIYPEGTRFTQQKKIQSHDFCEKNNLIKLDNVLYPRSKGFSLAVNELREYVKHIVDVTVYYENKSRNDVPTLLSFLFTMPKGKVYIKAKVYKIDEIKDSSDFVKNVFYEKDQTIQNWKNIIDKKSR